MRSTVVRDREELAREVIAGTARVAASVGLLVAAGGIGLLTIVLMMFIGGDIDYPEHPLSPFAKWALWGQIGVAVLCLPACIIPVVEDPLPRPAWLALTGLAVCCLVGCAVTVVIGVAGSLRVLGTIGALASLVCLWWLATGLRPHAPHRSEP